MDEQDIRYFLNDAGNPVDQFRLDKLLYRYEQRIEDLELKLKALEEKNNDEPEYKASGDASSEKR